MKNCILIASITLMCFGCGPSMDRSAWPEYAEKASALKKGMTKDEVSAIMGPPTHYGELWNGPPENPRFSGKISGIWDGKDKIVAVDFSPDGTVLDFLALEPPPLPPGTYRGFGLIKDKPW